MAIIAFFLIYFVMMIGLGTPFIFAIAVSALAIPFLFPAFQGIDFISLATTFCNNPVGGNTGLTIVLFVLAGEIMTQGEISNKIFNIFAYFLGKKRGFLPIVSVLTCMFYGAVNGSAPATTAAVGALCFPLLVSMGYDKVFSAALVAAAGTLGCIIPPSTVVTTISSFTNGLELVPLYTLSAIEGVICNILIIVYIYIYCARHGNGDQMKINAWVDELRAEGFSKVFFDSIWAILTPVIILGTIFTGIADTAQSAALALVWAIFVSVYVYKSIKLSDIPGILKKGFRSCAGVLLMVIFAAVMSGVMGQLHVADAVSGFVNGSVLSPGVILLISFALIVLLGCVNAAGSAWVFPLMYTLIYACGFEPYTSMIGMNLIFTTGAISAPVGLCLFVMLPLADCDVLTLGKKLVPYIVIYILTGMFFVYCPGIFSAITAGHFVPIP